MKNGWENFTFLCSSFFFFCCHTLTKVGSENASLYCCHNWFQFLMVPSSLHPVELSLGIEREVMQKKSFFKEGIFRKVICVCVFDGRKESFLVDCVLLHLHSCCCWIVVRLLSAPVPSWVHRIEEFLVFLCATRGKSFLESWDTTFLPDWQPFFIFVWFTFTWALAIL